MRKTNEHQDVYIIPPNFIETGTFFGGAFKIRNAIEAGILLVLTGLPVLGLHTGVTAKIIVLCFTALPLAIFGLIGIGGVSLSSFVWAFLKFLKNRRVLRGRAVLGQIEQALTAGQSIKTEPRRDGFLSYMAGYFKRSGAKQKTKTATPKRGKTDGSVEDYLPVQKIENGIVYTKDGRYIKILEREPINFLLRSAREQRGIIYSFVSYLKISPVKLQFKALTRKADINKHLQSIRREIENEPDENCRLLQEDYLRLIHRLGSREAITRRFFLIFEYEAVNSTRKSEEREIVSTLQTAVRTAKQYFFQCGNEVVTHDNEDEFLADVFYNILNRENCADIPIGRRVEEIAGRYIESGRMDQLNELPISEVIAPRGIDFTHGRYVLIDGIYHSYLIVPSGAYKPQVAAGWLSILVNAGEGIDVDMFLHRQPKEKVQRRLGQQLRINRSKIKDASDTNTDFDDIEGAIRSGYFLKEGLSNNEDFYYISLLITVTAENPEDLEWRIAEMKKLLVAQDMEAVVCSFSQEQAFLSALPLCSLDKNLYARAHRNVMTTGAASCYPLVSYEVCDDNGILLGVNKHNNSLVIVDLFNSAVYHNANLAILGSSGAGKTFLLQLMALRMRRKQIQVFIIAPLKGHEFFRACKQIGGQFIPISPASQTCINVMEIRKIDRAATEALDGPVGEKSELAAKIQKLHIFFSLLIPDMSHEERQLLDDAMIRTYAAKGITHNNETLYNPANPAIYREMPILGDLYEKLMENPETKRLANILNRLVGGSAKTFNQQTNVNLDNKYTVLDISELTGDLLVVGMFVALDFVWDKAKEDRTKEKAIFVDETWQLIGASSNRLAAEYVLEIFKTIRGYGGAAIAATQDINDFFALDEGKYGKGIINNAKTKIVLNLEEEEAVRVESILKLTETEVMSITHFTRGNGLISTNNNNIAVEFKASDLEKELITTDRYELGRILESRAAARTDEK
ncbi:MAG: PrgI family protein [Oscillospiraceae bacterium]|nr:PrgI family protein [Oscillospiraceae bacterium]